MKSGLLISIILIGCILVIAGCREDENPYKPGAVPCMSRAHFGDTASSLYVLPFPVGKAYILSQTYCNPDGGHSNQLAYDFALPIGAAVTASRAGVVKETRDDLPDTGTEPDPSLHNHVMIQHEDGSVAFYAHLKQHSVDVAVGDTVAMGDTIALSGNSGNTGNFPHLHIGIYQGWPPQDGKDLPFNFRHAEGPLDSLGGLVKDELYRALHYK